jgi:CHAT domain-containing protein
MRRVRAHLSRARVGRGGVILLAGVTTGMIVASALVAFWVRGVESSPNRRLAEAVGAHRVTRARLTGGFAYAPCDTVTPNDSLISGLLCDRTRPSQWPEAGALSKLAPEFRASSAGGGSAARGLQAIGAWHVVWGSPDAATRDLRDAAQLDPTNAAVQSDLAAALLQNAEVMQDPLLLLDAFVAADSAITLDPELPEASFNRAVALNQLGLHRHAAEQLAAYLKLDSTSAWAREARALVARLQMPRPSWDSAQTRLNAALADGDVVVAGRVVQQFPRRARAQVRARLTAWAHAYEQGVARSDTLLRSAVELGQVLARVTGDAQALDASQAIARTAAESDSARMRLVARGLIDYAIGRRYLDVFSLDSAGIWLGRARRALEASGNAAVYWVDYDLAQVPFQRNIADGFAESLVAFDRVYTTTPNAYRVTRGLAARSKGLIYDAVRVNYDAAIAAYAAAVHEGKGTGEPGLELRPRVFLASLYESLRGERAAWAQLYVAMRSSTRHIGATDEAQRIAVTAARLSRRRHLTAALMFQGEAVRLAAEIGSPHLMITGLSQEAELLGRAGLFTRAFDDVRRAELLLPRIETDSIRAVASAAIDLVNAGIWLQVRPDSAVGLLRRVVERHQQRQQHLVLDRAFLTLAEAYVAIGRMDSARVAFESALRETERRRGSIAADEDRAGLLDQARPVIDRFVRFLVDRADTVQALEFVERMRARVLLERGGSVPASRLRVLHETRLALPHNTSIVSYADLGSEIVIWLVRRDTISMFRQRLPGSLEEMVTRLSASITQPASNGEAENASGALYRLLIAPFVDFVRPESRLVFVPDKSLHFVPFAALLDPSRDRFLIESFEIAVTPSVELYARTAARYAKLNAVATSTILAVGNPAFDRRVIDLPDLPGAEREAVRVAAHYARTRILIGRDVTRGEFLREAARSDIVHFAGHGIVRSDAPLLSQLVLAADSANGESGSLYARDLFNVRLTRTRLAVLSGCQTADGSLSDTEGPSSLARALFAAGVPAVVASLWAVEDDPTAEFFDSYHRDLSKGIDPTTALRNTQLQWLKRGHDRWENAAVWAGFHLYGATTQAASLALPVTTMYRE